MTTSETIEPPESRRLLDRLVSCDCCPLDWDDDLRDLKRIASRISRCTGFDALDIFQEGSLSLWESGTMHGAIAGMRKYVRQELRERTARKELFHCWRHLGMTTRSFDGLGDALKHLTDRQRRIVSMWLDGLNLAAIGRAESCHAKTIKRVLITAFSAIAAWCGKEQINVEVVFPDVMRMLPKGIQLRNGNFRVSAGSRGRVYLGTYDSLEQAIEARRRWPGDFVTSPLDRLKSSS